MLEDSAPVRQPPTSLPSWRRVDEHKEPDPGRDIDDCGSDAASEITLDTCFRNQENTSQGGRSWSSFLGFGPSNSQQQSPSPPQSPTASSGYGNGINRQQSRNQQGGDIPLRAPRFFDFSQSNNPPVRQPVEIPQPPLAQVQQRQAVQQRQPAPSRQSSIQSPPQPQQNVVSTPKQTKLQQQQASLLQNTQQRSQHNLPLNNNTPPFDATSPGMRSLRSTSSNHNMGNQLSSRNAPQQRTPTSHSMSQQMMMVSMGGTEEGIGDFYPDQSDGFEEVKYQGHSGLAPNNSSTFAGYNPSLRTAGMRSPPQQQQITRSNPPPPPRSSPQVHHGSSYADFYGDDSSQFEFTPPRAMKTTSKPAATSRPAASTQQKMMASQGQGGAYHRSQSMPSTTQYGSPSDGNNNWAHQTPDIAMLKKQMSLQQQAISDDARMTSSSSRSQTSYRTGTGAGAVGGLDASGGNSSGKHHGSSGGPSDADIEYAIMLSIEEDKKRKELELAEQEALQEAMNRSKFNNKASIRLLQTYHYNNSR